MIYVFIVVGYFMVFCFTAELAEKVFDAQGDDAVWAGLFWPLMWLAWPPIMLARLIAGIMGRYP